MVTSEILNSGPGIAAMRSSPAGKYAGLPAANHYNPRNKTRKHTFPPVQ